MGFLGIAAVLFKEKGMGVIRVHAILPLRKNLFLLSKLAVFLLSDLVFAVLLTLLNVGLSGGVVLLLAVLLHTAILSLIMALFGLLCALLLKDFRQFTLAYLIIAIFAANLVIPGTDKNSRKYRSLARDMGLIITHPDLYRSNTNGASLSIVGNGSVGCCNYRPLRFHPLHRSR